MTWSLDTLAAVRRSNQKYHEQLAEQVTLSCGVAFLCPQFPELAESHQLREAVLPAGMSMSQAFNEVRSAFAARGLRCARWVPAAGQPIETMEAFLLDHGFIRRDRLALVWTGGMPPSVRGDLRFLPARAMRKALHSLAASDTSRDPAAREAMAVAENERMDDPQYDTIVAMLAGHPVAFGTLHQVGEIGRVRNVFVAEPQRRQGVGTALMHHLLAMSKRLAMRITVAETLADDDAGIAFHVRCGFEPAGRYAEFVKPGEGHEWSR